MKYSIGDIVKVRDDLAYHCLYGSEVFVEDMDCEFITITGLCSKGIDMNYYKVKENCYNYSDEMLENKVGTTSLPDEFHGIKIHKNGNVTIAIDFEGNKGIAKCHPDDEYDFRIGAEIAFNRLIGKDWLNFQYTGKTFIPEEKIENGGTVYADDPTLYKEYKEYMGDELLEEPRIMGMDADEFFDKLDKGMQSPKVKQILEDAPKHPSKSMIHANICDSIHELYKAKNADYGDSFAKVRAKFHNSILIRLNDKLNRLEQLYADDYSAQVNESIEDTLMDLAGYCILELTEMTFDSLVEE